jgi:hypothetical protein
MKAIHQHHPRVGASARHTSLRAATQLHPGRRFQRAICLAAQCVLLAALATFRASGDVNVTQFHNHLSRDGWYIDPAFTFTNAANLARDPAFNGAITGNVYAQPLYIEGGPRGRAVIIAVTESNNVYALDAFSGTVVWQTNVAPATPASALPCGDLSPFGITGTPVVDLASRSLFFDALTVDPVSNTVKHLIYSLNVDSGALNAGWPVDVNARAAFGTNHFVSLAQGARGALAVIGANVYVPYGGLYGDCGTYYGWVVGVAITNPAMVMAWATTAKGGGIWAVGGVASDGVDPFVATGNTFGAATWGGGEAIVHLLPNLMLTNASTITNYWAPTNWSNLDSGDLDLGGTGPLLVDLPGATPSNLVVAFGKDQNVYLLNRTNLGGVKTPVAQATVGSSAIVQAAATYRTTLGTYAVFANNNSLRALRLGAANPPTISNAWSATVTGRGSPFVTSTDGTNNLIVWGVGAEGDQRLHGFNADTGATVFAGGGANELMAGTRRFSTAIAARGRIYAGADNKIYAFRAPGQTVTGVAATNWSALPGGGFQFSLTNVPGALFNVFATTNLSEAFTNWPYLGEAFEVSPGLFQFTDLTATNGPARFYRVVSP